MPPSAGVKLEMGGKRRTLRYTMRSLDRLETETGFAWPQVQARLQMGSVRYLVWAVWAGLIHEDEKLTRDDVIDMMDALSEEEAKGVEEALQEALGAATESDDDEDAEGKAAAAG